MFSQRHTFWESEESLLLRSAGWPGHSTLECLVDSALRQISSNEGVDFATTLLFDRLRQSPRRSKFIQRIDELRRTPTFPTFPSDTEVVVIPGALYAERPDLGGDGRLIREIAGRFGLRSTLVPVSSVGSVSENARRLTSWLSEQSRRRLILVSLSKGSSDVKMALAEPEAGRLFRPVVAWVNVCGPIDGAAMANWILSNRLLTWLCRFHYRFLRRDFQFIAELRRGPGAPLSCSLRLPADMRLINLVGFPLKRHLSTPFSRFCHHTLSRDGPNDGTILLSDILGWPGETYPVWGADHYFRPETMAENLVTAVFHYLAETLEEPKQRLERGKPEGASSGASPG